jgi:uncharacterized protein YkwD
MSDHPYSPHYRRKYHHVLGENRQKKFLKITFAILAFLLIVAGYQVYSSGVLADDTAGVSQHVLSKINEAREAGNLPLVHESDNLVNQAKANSARMRVAPLAYRADPTAKSGSSDAYIIPKLSQILSSLHIDQDPVNAWLDSDEQFQNDVMNPDFASVGIGVESDGYNYYIVTQWE